LGTNFDSNRLRDRVANGAEREEKRTSDEEKREYKEIDLSQDPLVLVRGLGGDEGGGNGGKEEREGGRRLESVLSFFEELTLSKGEASGPRWMRKVDLRYLP